MKKYFSIIRFFILASVFILTGCVHDDKYDAPDLSGNCQDLKATITLEAAKSLINDIRQRHPNEELTCKYIKALETACSRAENS